MTLKNPNPLTPLERLNQQPCYTNYDLYLVRSSGQKVRDGNSFLWQGTLTFLTRQKLLDYVSVQRDLQALVLYGKMPMFGMQHHNVDILFDWGAADDLRGKWGDDVEMTIVIGYSAYIKSMTDEELQAIAHAHGFN